MIIKNQINKYEKQDLLTVLWKVVSEGDGIVEVAGLTNVVLNEIVRFENGSHGMPLKVKANIVGVITQGNYFDMKEDLSTFILIFFT